MRRSLLLPASLFLMAACGAPPPAEVAPQPVVTATPVADPGADTVPTTEPKSLLLLARWRAPAKGGDQVLKAFGSPVSVESLLSQEPEIGKHIDLDGSVDFAISLDPESTDDDPKVLMAFSLPLKSFDEARAAAEQDGPVTPVTGGALRLSSKRAEKAGTCDLSPSTSAPARLVCGQKARDVDALRPWLAKGLQRDPPAVTDLVITTRSAPLRDRYLPLLHQKGNALVDEATNALSSQRVTDPELLGVPRVLLDESLHFLEDVDGIDLKVSFSPTPPELVTSGVLRFGAKTSWLTRAMTEANDKAGPPPAIFWRAPRDATTATWGRGSDPHLYDGFRSVTHKAITELLSKVPLPDADKGAVIALFDNAPKSTGAWVSSQGLLKSKAKGPAAKGAPVDLKALTEGALGWTVIGVEAPAADYIAWAKQGVDVYGRALRIAHDFLALAGKAKAKGKGGKPEDPLKLAPKVTIASSPAGWPKGTVAFDVTVNGELAQLFAPKKKADAKDGSTERKDPKKSLPEVSFKGSLTVRLAIVPDGDRTWIGISADLDELKKRMNAVMSSAPEAGTLATRDGLERLRAGNQTWGGFFAFGGIVDRVVAEIEKEKPSDAAEVKAAIATLPNHGQTPLLVMGSGTPGDKPSNSAEIRLEGGTLADIAALVQWAIAHDGKKKTSTQQAPAGVTP